jgi:VWFA-related protein
MASMLFSSSRRLSVLVLCLVFSAAWSASSQDNGDGPVKSGETLTINVRVVNVFFNVRDHRGQFVPGVPKAEFTMLEDGIPQKIGYFSAEPNAALTLGLLIDTSPSQQKVLGHEQQVAMAFLNAVLQPKDLALVATVDSDAHILQGFTHDKQALSGAVLKVKVGEKAETLADAHAGKGKERGTILRDTIHMLSEQRFAHEQGRKALIILTDGEDFGSQLNIKQAIQAAQVADVICYVLLVADPNYYFSIDYNQPLKGQAEMKKVAYQTGGRLIIVGAKIERLQAAFDLIASELRHHYSIGYVSSNKALDGSFRKLTIKAQHGYNIQVRQGYYAMP